jgi:hypothetical protein
MNNNNTDSRVLKDYNATSSGGGKTDEISVGVNETVVEMAGGKNDSLR